MTVDARTRSLTQTIVRQEGLVFEADVSTLYALIAIPDRAPRRGESVRALDKAMHLRWKLIVDLAKLRVGIVAISQALDNDRDVRKVGDGIRLAMVATEDDLAQLLFGRPRGNQFSVAKCAGVTVVHIYDLD